ncbi:hypothetical protein [uncultured Parabacteroides sp.]|uniref:hypothetical protein n=1 Tax=uncultured Parabacteroides sp. TaxID=512312 RepID=UPI0025F57020|nr:hypothetical protein [uncultured Parabacteroides sp.]
MKRFIFILLFGLLHLSATKAQQVQEVVATANNDTIIVNCMLETPVFCSLLLQYSDNNGLTWNECKTIQGDITNQASGKKTIYWNCLKDDVIMGNFIFKIILHPSSISTISKQEEIVPAEPSRKSIPQEAKVKTPRGSFMVLPGCSFGNTMSYSLMLGYVKKWGGYVKVKSAFGSKDKNATKGDVDDAFFSGNSKKGRFSAYAGAIGQLHPYICIYAGIGYGNKWLQWETINNENIEIQSGTYSGIDPELGVLFKIKMLTVGGGFNCLIGQGHKNGEGNISIGIMF